MVSLSNHEVAGTGAGRPDLAVDLAPVADLDDEDQQFAISDIGDYANVSDAIFPEATQRTSERCTQGARRRGLKEPILKEIQDTLLILCAQS